MKLRREMTTGKIYDDQTAILLRGGHFNLFSKNRRGRRGLARQGSSTPFNVPYSGAPCVVNPTTCTPLPPQQKSRAVALPWLPERSWEQLFGVLRETGSNLLRVWVMGGTPVHRVRPGSNVAPYELYPFLPIRQGADWLWRVYDAVENDQWNEKFFTRLANFAAAADTNGVCLQLTLFNYHDLTDDGGSQVYQTWSRSPWNPELSVNPPGEPGWGGRNLLKLKRGVPNTERERQIFFIAPTNNLRAVQVKLVTKVAQKLRNRGNIIFEVMNEPRKATKPEVASFSSDIVEAIDAAAGADWTPLISVNTSQPDDAEPGFYTDWWRDHSEPAPPGKLSPYERVDVISYHALTGGGNYRRVGGCPNILLDVPPVDRDKIRLRIDKFTQAQNGREKKKALMLSTDAARIDLLLHKYCDVEHPGQTLDMHVRDGQISTGLKHDNSETPAQMALKSDLHNWAFWCFERGLGDNLGLVHFQNHSEFEAAFRQIHTGWQDATRPPA